MTSVVNQLLTYYQPKISYQLQWMETDQLKQKVKSKFDLLQKMGSHFIQLLILKGFEGSNCIMIKQNQLTKLEDKVSQFLGKKLCCDQSVIHQTIGLYVEQKFKKIQFYQQLSNQINVIVKTSLLQPNNQKDQTQQELQEFYESNIIDQQDQEFKNFLKFINEDENEIHKGKEIKKIQQPLQKLITQYLKEIRNPPTQLNQLAQYMNWKVPQYQTHNQSQKHSCIISQFIKEQSSAKSKKLGRCQSSYLVLKKIYLTYTDLWETFFNVKVNQRQIKIDIPSPKINDIKQQVHQYIANINGKSQLNLLCQQNPKFSLPNHLKKDQKGKWLVTTTMKIEVNEKQLLFTQNNLSVNSKSAQQQNCKKILLKLYSEHPAIWQRIKTIKQLKNIVT